MPLNIRINPFSRPNNDTGFATTNRDTGGRFLNKDGSFNLVKEGMSFRSRFSLFNDMLSIPAWKFTSILLLFFLLINVLFTCLFMLIGPEQLEGFPQGDRWYQFKQIFYFSTQTFTTVGYGHVHPIGDGAGLLAALEALSGLTFFAIVTGLIYGRFSKPKSYLVFSEQALVSPYRGGKAIMFRFAAYKEKHVLTDLEIRVNTGLLVTKDDRAAYQYFSLKLERDRVESLPMNWTVVHPLDEESPFFGFSADDMKKADVELYVMLRGYDDVFSNQVLQRTSYTYDEILFDRKFVPMYRESDDGTTTILELQKLNEHREI
jgi:inward rectifier potassium channel